MMDCVRLYLDWLLYEKKNTANASNVFAPTFYLSAIVVLIKDISLYQFCSENNKQLNAYKCFEFNYIVFQMNLVSYNVSEEEIKLHTDCRR